MTLLSAEAPRRIAVFATLAFALTGCVKAGADAPDTPPLAAKWLERAQASYGVADIEDAELAIENAQRLLPDDPEVRVLASRVALAQLEYDHCIELLEGLTSSDARSIRGRAFWYSGELDRAADELDLLLSDPEVRDPWAQEIAQLARLGSGRKPFTMSGDMLAVSDMPKTGTSAMVVPVELNGEPTLGMIATGVAEAVVDSSAGARASWISLRFADRLEVRDVPAIAKDLAGLSRQVNAPIKVLLGVNVLRHLNATFDFAGGQFVVRQFEPPPPPHATAMRLHYLQGGGMVTRSAFGIEDGAPVASLLVDTSQLYPLALDDGGWKKAGIKTSALQPVEGAGGLRQGMLPMMHLGAFEVPQVPGVLDDSVSPYEESLGVDLDGAVGSGLLAYFRVTLTRDGRSMWLEDMPAGTTAAAPPAGTSESAPTSPAEATPPGTVPPAVQPGALPGMPGLTPPQLTPPQP